MVDEHTLRPATRRGLSLRDVNGLAFVILALGLTVAFATLTEANYRAQDAKIAATNAEQTRQLALANAIAGQSQVLRPTHVADCAFGYGRKDDIAS